MATLSDSLAVAVSELDDEQALALVKTRLESGVDPLSIIANLQEGMTEVGMRFETGDYFLSELVLAGEIMREIMEELEPLLEGTTQEFKGNVVVGTVKGDVHDLGKNIVVMLLKGAGYNVIDLGVDVSTEKFINAITEYKAPLVGMSVLLTACQDGMKETIQVIRTSGLDIKIVIGGNYVDEIVKNNVGADFVANNASDAVKIADQVFA